MPKPEVDKGVVDAARSSHRRVRGTQVIVYTETSMTICTDTANREFIKFVVGHERTSPSDSEDALTKTETAAWSWNQKVLDKRLRRLTRMLHQIAAERDGR